MEKIKCDLCEKHIKFEESILMKNRFNANELRVCNKCAKEFGWCNEK